MEQRILEKSEAEDFTAAKKEWDLKEIWRLDEEDDSETCLCGHRPIREVLILIAGASLSHRLRVDGAAQDSHCLLRSAPQCVDPGGREQFDAEPQPKFSAASFLLGKSSTLEKQLKSAAKWLSGKVSMWTSSATQICKIANKHTEERVIVGNCCVKKFLELPSGKIFDALKRIEGVLLKA